LFAPQVRQAVPPALRLALRVPSDAPVPKPAAGATRQGTLPAAMSVKLRLKVVPGASREGVEGWLGDALKVRVRAAPEKGRANLSVEKLLAGYLGLPPAKVRVVSGFTAPKKVVEIEGLDPAALKALLPER